MADRAQGERCEGVEAGSHEPALGVTPGCRWAAIRQTLDEIATVLNAGAYVSPG